MRDRGRTDHSQPTSVSIQLMLPLSNLHELCFTITLHSLHGRYGVRCLRTTVVWHKTHAFSHSEGNCGFSWILGPGSGRPLNASRYACTLRLRLFSYFIRRESNKFRVWLCRKLLARVIPEPGLPRFISRKLSSYRIE